MAPLPPSRACAQRPAACAPGRAGAVAGLARARKAWALCAWLLAAAAAQGCKSGPSLATDYGATARENYVLAIGEFEDRDYEEAISYADFVRIRFPFSRYAVEAELLIARAEFGQGNYITAQDAFKQFAKLHPTHRHVVNGWVGYMAAASAYMNAPDRFFLLPPAYQRDQSQLLAALEELQTYYDRYGDTVTEPFARTLRADVQRRLLDHEMYVARYYLKRGNNEAVVGRLEAAHDRYPGVGLDADVLFLLGTTYLRIGEVELARQTFAELQTQHPTHHHGKQARLYLRYIQDEFGPVDPTRPRPDRRPPRPIAPPRPKNEAKPIAPGAVPAEPAAEPGAGAKTTPTG
jgi:outer membrane protein assembly factor BamD